MREKGSFFYQDVASGKHTERSANTECTERPETEETQCLGSLHKKQKKKAYGYLDGIVIESPWV